MYGYESWTIKKAAAAKSLQSCLTLCDLIDGSPPGSPIPGILQARTLEWVAISFSNTWKWKVKGKSLSRVRLFATPWTAAYQAPPSMGFARQEYWSGVPSPSQLMLSDCGAGEDSFENPLDSKEFKPVNPKENQPWIFIGRTDAEAEAPTLWPPNTKSQLIGRDPDGGKDRKQKEKKTAEDEMVKIASLTQRTLIWANSGRLGDREAWHASVDGVTKSQTWLSMTTTADSGSR